MNIHFKPLLVTALLASLGGLAAAQTAPQPAPGGTSAGPDCGMSGHRMARHESMGERLMHRMDRHLGELKAQLKLSAAQESAWAAFVTAMKPGADKGARRPDPTDLAKLSTPERLDRMKAMRTQHMADINAAMERREQATRSLYEALTPEQKAQFDVQTARHLGRRGHHAG